MGRVRHPNLQKANGNYLEGATVTAITNRDTDDPAEAYTTEEGGVTVTYPVTSGAEGELDIWVPVGAYETTFGSDLVDTPAVWEAISGEELANMLTIDDVPGFPDNVFSPLTYGGDPTGTADSTTAIQAAIDAAAAVRGTVHFGNGTSVWKHSGYLSGATGIRLTSGGGGGRAGTGAATVRYTGAEGAGWWIESKQRFEIDHLEFEYSNTAFTGALMHLDGGGGGGDIINAHIHHCAFRAQNAIASLSADCGLRLHKVIISEISECSFNGFANNLIQCGQPSAGSSYVNQVSINNCAFNDIADHDRGQICIYSSDVEALVIDGCTFEGASPNNIVPIRGANVDDGDARTNLIYQMTVRNCWSGDAGGGGPPNGFARGLNGLGNFAPVTFEGNFIGPSAGSVVFTSGQNGCAFLVLGNHITQGTMFGSDGLGGSYKFFSAYNRLPGAPFDTADAPLDYTSFGQTSSHLNSQGIEPMSSPDFLDYVAGVVAQARDTLIIGGKLAEAAGWLNIGDRTAIYTRDYDGGHTIVIQADQTDDDGEIQLVAGITPAAKVRASGDGVGFQGNAPFARPTITGSRGGNAALADLLTKLANYGLITDGTSA